MTDQSFTEAGERCGATYFHRDAGHLVICDRERGHRGCHEEARDQDDAEWRWWDPRPFTEADVEAGAKAMVVREAMEQGRSVQEAEERWYRSRKDYKDLYRLNARTVLTALSEHRCVSRVVRTLEVENERLRRERDEAREWAHSSDNPAFDAGWSAGKKRVDHDMREVNERLRNERDELRAWQRKHSTKLVGESDPNEVTGSPFMRRFGRRGR